MNTSQGKPLEVEPEMVKIGQPTYHRKRKYFTLKATGDVIHEVNLDYLAYPLIPTDNTKETTS